MERLRRKFAVAIAERLVREHGRERAIEMMTTAARAAQAEERVLPHDVLAAIRGNDRPTRH